MIAFFTRRIRDNKNTFVEKFGNVGGSRVKTSALKIPILFNNIESTMSPN